MHSTREGVRTDKTCQLAPRHSPDPQRPTTGRFPPSRRQHRGGGEAATPDGHIRTARRQMTASVSISNATPYRITVNVTTKHLQLYRDNQRILNAPPASAPSATPPPPDRSSWPSSKPPPTPAMARSSWSPPPTPRPTPAETDQKTPSSASTDPSEPTPSSASPAPTSPPAAYDSASPT